MGAVTWVFEDVFNVSQYCCMCLIAMLT